jgi:hypothetical protein
VHVGNDKINLPMATLSTSSVCVNYDVTDEHGGVIHMEGPLRNRSDGNGALLSWIREKVFTPQRHRITPQTHGLLPQWTTWQHSKNGDVSETHHKKLLHLGQALREYGDVIHMAGPHGNRSPKPCPPLMWARANARAQKQPGSIGQ